MSLPTLEPRQISGYGRDWRLNSQWMSGLSARDLQRFNLVGGTWGIRAPNRTISYIGNFPVRRKPNVFISRDRVRADICLKSRQSSLLVASIIALPALTQQGVGDELLFGTHRRQVAVHQFEAPRLLFSALPS